MLEIGLVLEGHASARHRDLELAYYTAFHAGLFSQPYKPGKFPDYQKHAPKRPGVKPKPVDPETMLTSLKAFVIASGGKIIDGAQ